MKNISFLPSWVEWKRFQYKERERRNTLEFLEVCFLRGWGTWKLDKDEIRGDQRESKEGGNETELGQFIHGRFD